MYEKGVWEYDAGHLAEAIELEAGPRGAAKAAMSKRAPTRAACHSPRLDDRERGAVRVHGVASGGQGGVVVRQGNVRCARGDQSIRGRSAVSTAPEGRDPAQRDVEGMQNDQRGAHARQHNTEPHLAEERGRQVTEGERVTPRPPEMSLA